MGQFYRELADGLTLYVRQQAFLWTAPKPVNPVPGQPKPRSRLDEVKAHGGEPDMPDNPAPHMIDRLSSLGWAQSNGMDREPVSWERMRAWQEMTGTRLKPWEAKLLQRLSVEYLAECRRAEEPHCLPPYMPAHRSEQQKAAELRRLESVLG